MALQILKDPTLAEEVVQDVFTGIWKNREQLEAIAMPPAYLFTITRNRSLDMLRKIANDDKLRELVWKQMEEDRLITNDMDISELEKLIQQAIRQLPEKRRQIFLLSREAGLSYDRIGAEMGISKNTVKTQLQLAVKDIKAYLEPYRLLYWLGPFLHFFL